MVSSQKPLPDNTKTQTRDRHSCRRQDSNLQFQQANTADPRLRQRHHWDSEFCNAFKLIFNYSSQHLLHVFLQITIITLTLILLTWTIWRAPTNASKWRMGFNSTFKGLMDIIYFMHRVLVRWLRHVSDETNILRTKFA